MQKQELNKKIEYIEQLTDRVVKSLKGFNDEIKDNHISWCWANSNRAKFSRLRVELTKELKAVDDYIYGRSQQ